MTRRFRRIIQIRRTAALALAVTAVAAPAAVADTPTGADQLAINTRTVAVDRVSPDARDAGRPAPAIDRVSPDARDNGRRETAPLVPSAPSVVASDHFDWLDAGIGAAGLAVLLLLGGTAVVMRTRRGPIGAA